MRYQDIIEVIEQRLQQPSASKQYDRADYELTINFHPDRLTIDGKPLLSAIAKNGRIKSQFETGTSNGGLSANGGDRWHWEQRVFGGAYDTASASQRPKYAALNYANWDFGGSPRFGSSYFRLAPHLLERSTFCYPDSYFQPSHFATERSTHTLINLAKHDDTDWLDRYIEAHIHGDVSLADDVTALVLDPIYKGGAIEALAHQLPVAIEWHQGFRLNLDTLVQHSEYRGQVYVDLARKIALDGVITADLLAHAIQSGHCEQDIKKIWHYLARFGHQRW